MRYYALIPLFLFLFLLGSPALADSTQQYNKIYLNPFYVNSISAGGSSLFSTILNPPDRISSVTSAIIGFNAQINGQTQNFTLRVNGQACNPSSYVVATAFSTTGNIQFYFDCTSRISKAGTYQINLSSSVATGAITGWMETTYMNNPSGNIKYVGGTDYFQGEKATVFLQLQSSDGSAVNNASCNFDMYNTSSMLSAPIYSKQPMVFRGADGIYYYQFLTAGYPEGVYPLDAECVYNYDNYYFYDGFSNLINVTTNSGSFVGGSSANLNSPTDSLYMAWTGTTNITYRWNNATGNITKMDLYWTGENSVSRTITFYAFNYTSSLWQTIGSVITGTGGSTTNPTGVDDLFTANIPLSFWNGTTVSIIEVQSGAGSKFVNWVTLKAYKNSTYVTEVKGSSEVHIYSLNITQNIKTPSVNFTQVITDIAQVNNTVTAINTSNSQQTVFLTTINSTTAQNNILLLAINSTVTAINNYLNGFVTSILTSINQTVTAINGKNFAPNITVNASFNITNVTVVVNTTNTTVAVNTTSVSLNNVTVVVNTTNTTVVVNTTQVSLVNTTVVVNTTQVNLANITVVVNTTNTTVSVNTINMTVVVNTTQVSLQNTTVVINTTNVTFSPVINTTVNLTVNVTDLNSTAQEILGLAQQINATTLANNAILISINNTVTAISNYLNGFITTMLNDIYALLGQVNQTTTQINSKDFMPNITVNTSFNVTSTEVVVNTTNTTVNLTTQVVVFNITNTTYVANITVNNSVVFGGNITINVTAEVNTTQLINDILNAQITETIL